MNQSVQMCVHSLSELFWTFDFFKHLLTYVYICVDSGNVIFALINPIVVHFEDQMAVLNEDVLFMENRGAIATAPVTLLPSTLIEAVEIVPPMVLKLTSLLVVLLHFDIVVPHIPRHALIVEVVAPARERRRPEVHEQVLPLSEELHIGRALGLTAHAAIDFPGDMLRCPLDHILVEVVAWLEVGTVGLVMALPPPNDVHTEGVLRHRRHNLDIYLVPMALLALRHLVVESEEGVASAMLVLASHTGGESAIGESLNRVHFATRILAVIGTHIGRH